MNPNLSTEQFDAKRAAKEVGITEGGRYPSNLLRANPDGSRIPDRAAAVRRVKKSYDAFVPSYSEMGPN